MRLKIWLSTVAMMTSVPALAQQTPLVADGGFLATPIADCKTDLRYLNQVGGWQTAWPREWETAARASEFAAAIDRWQAMPAVLDEGIAKLRAGIAAGEMAPRAVVIRVHQQVRDLALALSDNDPKYFSDHDDGNAWNQLLTDTLLPALRNYETFLHTEYLPVARVNPGMSDWEGGGACFEKAALWWTTLDLSSEEIENIGNRILEDTRADLVASADEGTSFDQIMKHLRDGQKTDETTAESLIAISEAALQRAQDNTLSTFNHKASDGITVNEMPAHMQASFPAGFYQRPTDDAPAAYVINPSRAGERRLMAEVIAFHEGAPGHHLFFTYPRDTTWSGYNAGLLEGWAIYAEYLADEMGLYSSTFDRQGMMAKHLWAASRLVVEPGLHLHGWSRDDAINFMLENTVLSQTEIEIEVDRYIAMPGQSLSYMLGADYLLKVREDARTAMGDDFDLQGFHHIVLEPGVRPLPEVGTEIQRWSTGATDGQD